MYQYHILVSQPRKQHQYFGLPKLKFSMKKRVCRQASKLYAFLIYCVGLQLIYHFYFADSL